MSGFTYSIIFNLQGTSAIAQATSMTQTLDSSVNRLTIDVNLSGRAMTNMGNQGSSAFSNLQSKIAGVLATVGAMRFGLDSLNTAADVEGMQNAIRFASGKEGQKNIDFLNQTVNDLNLNLESSLQGFKMWQGGIMGTSLEGEKGRQVFRSVAEATTAMALSGQDSNGVFLALSQIISKGKVQAEELRGQIGERLPGAFGIAARAMGVSQQELNKMLDDGKLISEDFLPKFAAELSRTFGAGAQTQINSARSNFNQLSNTIFTLKNRVGTELMPSVISLIQNAIIPTVDWIGRNIDVLGMLATSLGTVYLVGKSYALITTISAALTGTFTGTIWGLNAAMLANPATWLVLGIVAIGTAVVYAWNRFEGFRGFMFGMWEVLKETGKLIYDFMIQPLFAFGKTLIGVMTFDRKMIAGGIAQMSEVFKENVFDRAKEIGLSFAKGYGDGVRNFNAEDSEVMNLANKKGAVGSAFGDGTTPPGTSPAGDMTKLKSGIDSITGGGKQVKNISITLRNLVENLTVQSQNVREGADEVRDILTRELLQVLNTSNQMQ